MAQDALLDSVAVKSADTADNQVKRTELAQQVLLKLDALDWQVEKVAFINGLISDQLVATEGGFERFWHGVKGVFPVFPVALMRWSTNRCSASTRPR
ncbi:hypothetical protein [Marinicella meishanensis]|uniref:hypothetical protein n=1 Tax=Marinicella meishanensis TaxID=2873263 RepID=UPI001CBABC12|nr:hypothetical protein [Marinicella sp. NBU2979]